MNTRFISKKKASVFLENIIASLNFMYQKVGIWYSYALFTGFFTRFVVSLSVLVSTIPYRYVCPVWLSIRKLTRRLSGLEILNNATLIIQKWLVSRLFANIFHYLNSAEEFKWQFPYFFVTNRNNDLRKNHYLIMTLIII